jgi:hypothetical protein
VGSKRRRESDTDDEDLSDPAIQQEIARLQVMLQEKRLKTRLSARVMVCCFFVATTKLSTMQ